MDDYRFNQVFSKPEAAFKRICGYNFLLTPDFSLYREMPTWKLIENVAKSRWCGAYWQSKGKTIIPTISWSGISNISMALSAIEIGCVVAVSTVGCRNSKFDFLLCYDKMLEVLEPPKIVCVGKPFAEMQGNIVTIRYSRTKKVFTEENILENLDLNKEQNLILPFEDFAI